MVMFKKNLSTAILIGFISMLFFVSFCSAFTFEEDPGQMYDAQVKLSFTEVFNRFGAKMKERIGTFGDKLGLIITLGVFIAIGFVNLFFITPIVFIINTCISGCYNACHRSTVKKEEAKIYEGLNARCEVLEVYSKLESVNNAPTVGGTTGESKQTTQQ